MCWVLRAVVVKEMRDRFCLIRFVDVLCRSVPFLVIFVKRLLDRLLHLNICFMIIVFLCVLRLLCLLSQLLLKQLEQVVVLSMLIVGMARVGTDRTGAIHLIVKKFCSIVRIDA